MDNIDRILLYHAQQQQAKQGKGEKEDHFLIIHCYN